MQEGIRKNEGYLCHISKKRNERPKHWRCLSIRSRNALTPSRKGCLSSMVKRLWQSAISKRVRPSPDPLSFRATTTPPHTPPRASRQAGVPESPQGFEQAAEVVADQEKPPQGGGGETEENHRTGGDLCHRIYATVGHRTAGVQR